MKYYGITDIGNGREINEDCFGVTEIGKDALLVVVCDGMGGHNCGEVASAMVLKTFTDVCLRLCRTHMEEDRLRLSAGQADVILSNAVAKANSVVYEYQKDHEESAGMGTTLVAALISLGGRQISWVNVGDSRLYTVDPLDILQVTKDHSYIQYMIDKGELTLKDAKNASGKNLITRAVGIGATVEPDIDTFPVSDKEREVTSIFLCTDGLCGVLSEEECDAIVRRRKVPVEDRARKLVTTALKKQGGDNITVVLVDLSPDA